MIDDKTKHKRERFKALLGPRVTKMVKYHKQIKNLANQRNYVYTEQEAADRGLEIDHDDSHCFGDGPFALLVHGSQPAGSDASAAIQKRTKEGGFVGDASKQIRYYLG